jgi:hypothetical protein
VLVKYPIHGETYGSIRSALGEGRRAEGRLVWELTYCRAVTKRASGPIPTCERVALIGAVGARNVRGFPPPSLRSTHQWHWLGCLRVPIGYTYHLEVEQCILRLSTAATLKHVTYSSSLQGISQCDLESYSSSPFARLFRLFFAHILSSLQDLIHNPEINRLLGIHEIVAYHELLNLVQTSLLCQVLLINLVQSFPNSQDLLRVICNVARLARVPPARLVDHDSCVWQDVSVSSLSAAKQQRAHRCCLAHTDRADWAADVVHRVVDGEACTDTSTWRVDIQRDWFFRIIGLEEQELCNDHGGHGFFDFAVQANDALLEQTREDVRGFPASALQSQPWGEMGVCRRPTTVSVTYGIGNEAARGDCWCCCGAYCWGKPK